MESMKSQSPSTKSQGVGCQVSGVIKLPGVRFQVSGKQKKLNTATCWSEAEIPSEAKRQRGTLNTETSRRSQSLPAKPLNSDLAPRTRFAMTNQNGLTNLFLEV